MKRNLIALLAGVLFSLGLCISRMADPVKVINFLDVADNWDPSLLFVMGGALVVTIFAFQFILKRSTPLFDTQFTLPSAANIDKKLIGGASLFGIGWGMVGYCPGPAITALGFGLVSPVIAVAAMLSGFMIHKLIFDPKK